MVRRRMRVSPTPGLLSSALAIISKFLPFLSIFQVLLPFSCLPVLPFFTIQHLFYHPLCTFIQSVGSIFSL
ncbi:hypothetical protein DFS34DRAFT_184233 [Phlyctochytrium arcticum]|nr:hypothetical protein DFS34DRAFT_184233 [Phlyctochytrium arcticum]